MDEGRRYNEEMSERILREPHEIVAAVSEITGLHSHWSGVVKLVEGADFKGQKPFQCDILLHADLASKETRWRTLLHEALHSFSQGCNREDFENFRGWEEGVVEKLQRLLRPTVLSLLGVAVEEALFRASEEQHLYNSYLDALAELQQISGQPEQNFYVHLLGTPIRDRPASVYVLSRQMTGPTRVDFLRRFPKANSILQGEIRWNLLPPKSSTENGSSV